jgi:protein polybromo-1
MMYERVIFFTIMVSFLLQWKKLTAHEKNVWEEKAARVNEEALAKMERGETTTPAPPTPATPAAPRTYVPPVKLPDQVWECLWDTCDYMFEDQLDCLDHAVADQKGHVSSWFASLPNKISKLYSNILMAL